MKPIWNCIKKNGRCAPTGDFYRNFSVAEFGKGAGEKAADIFAEQDGNMPRPSRWEDGPGNIYCNEIPWDDMKKQYDFVDKFEKLGTLIHSAGEKSRYDYWNHTFQAMKRTAEIGCLWGSFEITVKQTAMKVHWQIIKNCSERWKSWNIIC